MFYTYDTKKKLLKQKKISHIITKIKKKFTYTRVIMCLQAQSSKCCMAKIIQGRKTFILCLYLCLKQSNKEINGVTPIKILSETTLPLPYFNVNIYQIMHRGSSNVQVDSSFLIHIIFLSISKYIPRKNTIFVIYHCYFFFVDYFFYYLNNEIKINI